MLRRHRVSKKAMVVVMVLALVLMQATAAFAYDSSLTIYQEDVKNVNKAALKVLMDGGFIEDKDDFVKMEFKDGVKEFVAPYDAEFVVVKGGPDVIIYFGVKKGEVLTAALNRGGQVPAISYVMLPPCPPCEPCEPCCD